MCRGKWLFRFSLGSWFLILGATFTLILIIANLIYVCELNKDGELILKFNEDIVGQRPLYRLSRNASYKTEDFYLTKQTLHLVKLFRKPAITKSWLESKSFSLGDLARDNARGLWPRGQLNDRILYQLHYTLPFNSLKTAFQGHMQSPHEKQNVKVIVDFKTGSKNNHLSARYLDGQCSVNNCLVTQDVSAASSANAIVFGETSSMLKRYKPAGQIWVLNLLESPFHGRLLNNVHHKIDWTATYRRDSTLVTPYEKFVLSENFTKLPEHPARNYAAGKTKAVAWFVSNCRDSNGRLKYARELQKYIKVDIYGRCGTHQCPRTQANECFQMLNRDYKFYLAFENSNCRDYITEKFYWNALFNDVVPVVMGARKEDYHAVAPPGSFIHVDDFPSPKALAEYLHKLDNNDTLYNEYFRWKGTGHFIDTKFWCRLCALLHSLEFSESPPPVDNIENWWKSPGVCIKPKGSRWATWRFNE